MENRLIKLMAIADEAEFDKALDLLCKEYENDEAAMKQIHDFIRNGVTESGKRIEALALRVQLQEISEIINLSYIAKHYFKKSKSWLSQRINNNIVNGKPAKLTNEEIDTLNFALQDLGKRIGSFSVLH